VINSMTSLPFLSLSLSLISLLSLSFTYIMTPFDLPIGSLFTTASQNGTVYRLISRGGNGLKSSLATVVSGPIYESIKSSGGQCFTVCIPKSLNVSKLPVA
jgi:hypothetical protein